MYKRQWEHETSEDAEAKSFWDGFFHVFDVSRRRVATFEQAVRKGDSKQGFIDLLWKGVILVEHKSRGKDLDKAFQQAKDYFPGLKEHELPRYILVSDFQRFRLYDLDTGAQNDFELGDLPNQVHLFGFIAGYKAQAIKAQDPVNIKAAERMGRLHDALKASGYTGHPLEVLLVRLLFCLFADDTGIFPPAQSFRAFVEERTAAAGPDPGAGPGPVKPPPTARCPSWADDARRATDALTVSFVFHVDAPSCKKRPEPRVLRLEVDGKLHKLGTGDAIQFAADVPHRYRNPGRATAVLYMVIQYR